MLYIPSRDILLPSRPLLPYLSLKAWEQGTKPWHKADTFPGWAPGRDWLPGKAERECGFHCMPAGIMTHRRVLNPVAAPVGPSVTPMSFWRLEEAAGNRIDSAANGFDLVPSGAPGNGVGLIGNGAVLNGSTQHLDWGGVAFTLGVGVSITAWIWAKFVSFNASECAWISQINAAFTQGWWVGDNGTGGKPFLYARSISNGLKSVQDAGFSLTTATWFFMVFRYDSAAKTAYVRTNDTSEASVSTVSDLAAGGVLAIGNGQEGIFPHATMDAAAYFNSSLSSADLTAGFNLGLGTEWYSGSWH